jgi:hypothetical protein
MMLPENEARRLLYAEQIDLSPVSVRVTGVEVPIADGRADFLLELVWNEQRRQFIAEYVSTGTPRQVSRALAQARRNAKQEPDTSPMVIAPYLSDGTLDQLLSEQVSGMDLSGNAAIVVPGQWLIVLRGRENQFPASAPIKAVYEGTSSLVGRVFFARREYQMVKEVREEILRRGGEISMGTVSKVLKALEEDLVISRRETIRLLQPERLLQNLKDNYTPIDARRRVSGRLNLDGDVRARLLDNARTRSRKGAPVRLVGRLDARYVVGPSTQQWTLYTTSIPDVLADTGFEETDRFANVEVVETEDPRVYFDAREDEEFLWVAPLQVYLELMSGGKREREIARQLEPDLFSPPRDFP